MPSLNQVILRNLLYIYVIIVLLLVILPLNSATTANDIFVLKLRADYLLHIFMFIPWAFFQAVFRLNLLHWLLIGLFFASTAEGLQYFLPYRAFNINDLLANLLGVMAGFAVLILYHFTTKNRNRR